MRARFHTHKMILLRASIPSPQLDNCEHEGQALKLCCLQLERILVQKRHLSGILQLESILVQKGISPESSRATYIRVSLIRHLDSCRRTMSYVRRTTSYNTDVAHDVVRDALTTSYTYNVVHGAHTTSYIDVVRQAHTTS